MSTRFNLHKLITYIDSIVLIIVVRLLFYLGWTWTLSDAQNQSSGGSSREFCIYCDKHKRLKANRDISPSWLQW